MRFSLKLFFVFLVLSFMVMRPTSSYAYWHGHGWVGVSIGVPGPYYYGYPYSPYYYGDPYYPPAYVVASSAYQPVVVNGVTYYLNNGVYYIYTQYGYQAVAAPAGVSAPVVQAASVTAVPASTNSVSDDAITINIPNDKGGYTAVILKRSGNGFVGPQGEFYPEFPKVSQLQTIYGK